MGLSTTLIDTIDSTSWLIVVLFITFTYHAARAIYRVYFHPLSSFPGPTSRAISHLPQMFYCSQGIEYKQLAKLHDEYGGVVRIAPNELSYATPGAAKDIYGYVKGRKQIPKDQALYNTFDDPVRRNLDMTDEDHARTRRLLSPAFTSQALAEHEPLMTQYFDLLISKLYENISASSGPAKVDMACFYNATTFDLIGDLSFGESFNALENNGHPWITAIFENLRVITFLYVAYSYPLIINPFLFGVRHIPALAALKQKGEDFTNERMRRRLALEQSPEKPTRKDFTHFILRHSGNEKRAMTEPELYVTSAAFLVAGSETSATLLSGATYLLLQNPPCLHKLIREIRTTFATADEITVKSTQNLPYLRAVLDESLRCYPPVTVTLPRVTDGDTRVDGRVVPGEIRVGVSQWAMHRSGRNFREPERFVPERWLGAEGYGGDVKEAFQPFSQGPRNCVGKTLAYAEMTCILSRIIYHFDLSLCEESGSWMDHLNFTFWEQPPLMVRIEERKVGL